MSSSVLTCSAISNTRSDLSSRPVDDTYDLYKAETTWKSFLALKNLIGCCLKPFQEYNILFNIISNVHAIMILIGQMKNCSLPYRVCHCGKTEKVSLVLTSVKRPAVACCVYFHNTVYTSVKMHGLKIS